MPNMSLSELMEQHEVHGSFESYCTIIELAAIEAAKLTDGKSVDVLQVVANVIEANNEQ